MTSSAGLCFLATALAAAAWATAASAQAGAVFALPAAPVPAEIHGVACEPRPGEERFAPSLKCRPKDALKQPSFSVAVYDLPTQPSREELIATERRAFQNRPIFNVIREEEFAPPSDPEAVGMRGLYQTEFGNRYVWAVHSRGKLVRVLAMVFGPTDFPAMIADVESKVFGVPAPPAAAAKDAVK